MWRCGSVFGYLTRSKNGKDSSVLHTGVLETATQEARIARPSGIAKIQTLSEQTSTQYKNILALPDTEESNIRWQNSYSPTSLG